MHLGHWNCAGGEADIWKGTYNSTQIAIGHCRFPTSVLEKYTRKVCLLDFIFVGFVVFFLVVILTNQNNRSSEGKIFLYRQLQHDNVLLLLGVSRDRTLPFLIVTSWMIKGNSKRKKKVKETPNCLLHIVSSDFSYHCEIFLCVIFYEFPDIF